jgi:UDP-glucose 4-epimerase
MKRILVTGGAGYVGSACCAQLMQRGLAPEVVDDLSTGHAEAVPYGLRVHQFNYGDCAALESLLAREDFDTVFHFAAKALIPESVTNPGIFFSTNVASGIAMLETLRKHGIRRFVFSSSAAVYGSPRVVPIPEDHDTQPVNSYGESKLIFEQILRWYASAYGWSVVAFRYFNACGGGAEWGERHHPETHIIPLLLQTASGRREFFDIYGSDYPTPDGTCLRDYVHVLDIAEAHILAGNKLASPGFNVYNIGTGQSYSVKQVSDVASRISGQEIKTRCAPRREGDPAVLCASPRKLMEELGWRPRHSRLDEIISGAWEWEQRQCKDVLPTCELCPMQEQGVRL